MKKRSYSRIKYKEKNEGIWISIIYFISITTDASYYVEMNINNMTYRIINIRNQEVIKSTFKDKKTPPTNKQVLQRHIKSALKKLGVIFEPEVKLTSKISLDTLEKYRYKKVKKCE